MIAIAQLMVVLDVTIVNIAMPSAQRDLGFSDGNRQWIVTAYALAFGSLLLLGGRLADLFGRKIAFLVGIAGFAGSSALAGAAPSFEVLVTGRVLQGLFGALLAPAALAVLNVTFTTDKDRARAFGVFGAIGGAGGAFGLLLGGLLTEHLSWRWTLYVNLVFAVVAFAGGLVLMRKGAPAVRPRLDLPGTVLGSAGLFGLVYGFANAETYDWSSPMTWGTLIAAALLLTVFAWWQTRAPHPLLPLRVLADRTRGASFLVMAIASAGLFGVFLFLTYYLQASRGLTPVRTGLAFLPMMGSLMVVAQLSISVLLPKVGPKILVPLGLLTSAAGLALLTALDLNSGYAAGGAARAAPDRFRYRPVAAARDESVHPRGPGRGRGCRLRHGQHDAAGRRRHRHRAAQHPRRERRDRLPRRQGSHPGHRGPGPAAQLLDRVLVVGRPLRRRCRDRRAHVPQGPSRER